MISVKEIQDYFFESPTFSRGFFLVVYSRYHEKVEQHAFIRVCRKLE